MMPNYKFKKVQFLLIFTSGLGIILIVSLFWNQTGKVERFYLKSSVNSSIPNHSFILNRCKVGKSSTNYLYQYLTPSKCISSFFYTQLNENKQNELVDILGNLTRALDTHSISYMLSDGSLIGSNRHHGFIPWDSDVDIELRTSSF